MLSKALALEQFNANFTSLGTSWSPIPNFCLPKELVCMQVTYFMWKPIMIIIGWTKTYKAIPKSWKVYMHVYMLPLNMSNVLSSWTSNFGRRPLERGWRWVGWPPYRAHSTDRKDICSLRDHHHFEQTPMLYRSWYWQWKYWWCLWETFELHMIMLFSLWIIKKFSLSGESLECGLKYHWRFSPSLIVLC